MFPYPFSYFSSIVGFRRPFANRRQLSWFQIVFTSIFLVSLSLIPLALQTARLTSYDLSIFVPQVYESLTDETMQILSEQVTIRQGQLMIETPQIVDTPVGRVLIGQQTDPNDTRSLKNSYTLCFDRDRLIIKQEDRELADIRYQAIDQKSLSSRDRLAAAISQDWFQQNRLIISLFLLLSAGLLLALNFSLVSLGAAFLLYLTKRSQLFGFQTFRECCNFILNCLGLPILISCLCGLLGQALPAMITLENILFVLYLLLIFYKTHFRDEEDRPSSTEH